MATRRDFMRGAIIAALVLALAAPGSAAGQELVEIEIVGVEIDEDVVRACTTVGRCHVVDGQAIVEVSFDQDRAMDAVTLVDSAGNRYRYRDFVRWLEEMGVDVG